MDETFKLIRVFLASPGDLQDERRSAKYAVEELNKGIASYLGFRVELKGWEDTLSGSGRPQAIINQELDRCELFIGIMWKKWGTPPAIQGPYSSGFEEEFERSSERLKETGQPEMAMYFKEITKEFLVDPGKDLKKVISFRKRITSEKSILFETFSEANEFQKCVRQKITDYLINLNKAEVENLEEKQSKTKSAVGDIENTQDNDTVKSPFSAEGHTFLKEFLEKTEAEDNTENITRIEVARFRLLSSTISKSGNHEPFLGVHDANIIFSNKHITYGTQEISRLIDCGLKNIGHENTPLWYWYNIYKEDAVKDFLAFKSFSYSDEDVSAGALEAMKLIGTMLPIEGGYVNRIFLITNWLSEKSSDSIKLAALRYLKHHGKDEDLPLIQSELDRANSKTARISLEVILSIQLRYSKGEALKTAFINHFQSIDEALLEEVLSVSSILDDEVLKLGLKHRNKRIRLESFKRLRERKKINSDELKELKNDSFALIRKEVVDFLLSDNQPLSDKEVKNILIKPQKSVGISGLYSPTQSDKEGEKCYDEYLFLKHSAMTEGKLLELTKEGAILNDIPYVALCNRYFKNHSKKLRKNVADQFKENFKDSIENWKSRGMPEEALKRVRDLEDFVREKLTRKGLDILCKKEESKDLNLIRKNMRSEYVKSSIDEIEYMRKFGEWEDIPFVVKAKKDNMARTLLTGLSNNNDWYHSIAKAIYNIGRDRLEELLKIEIPPRILVELIKTCSFSKFSEISDETLLSLLNSKEDKVRKIVSLKSIQSFKKSLLKSLLKKYMESENSSYYNVIFWLDFGISMPKLITSRAIKLVLNE
jgi:Domain of unknown function (DUF4062)